MFWNSWLQKTSDARHVQFVTIDITLRDCGRRRSQTWPDAPHTDPDFTGAMFERLPGFSFDLPTPAQRFQVSAAGNYGCSSVILASTF